MTVLNILRLCNPLKILSQPLSLARFVIGIIIIPSKAIVAVASAILKSIDVKNKYETRDATNKISNNKK